MIRAVLDTNLFVSALISPLGIPAQLLDLWRAERFLPLISEPILVEIERVLSQPRLRRGYGLTVARIEALIMGLRRFALLTSGELEVTGVARDPDDDKLLACALEGNADYLVTGDHDLLDLGSYQGIPIITAAAFLQMFEES